MLVRDRVKFRVGRIVFVAFSRDETLMGFGFPKDERDALIAAEPEKFLLPEPSDLRYQWVVVRLAAIDVDEMRELVLDAWRMCVPKKVSALGAMSSAGPWRQCGAGVANTASTSTTLAEGVLGWRRGSGGGPVGGRRGRPVDDAAGSIREHEAVGAGSPAMPSSVVVRRAVAAAARATRFS